MAEFYRSETRSICDNGRRGEQRSPVMALIDGVMVCVSAVVAALMLFTYLVPYLSTRGWLLPVLGLVAPATYVVTVCLMLYWIIRWRWIWASVMIVPVFIGLFYLNLFLRPEFRRDYGATVKGRDIVTVMTYNVRNFFASDGTCSRDSLLAWVRGVAPDILCMQEFTPSTGGGTRELIDSLLAGYHSTPADPRTGCVVYSRYPILRWGYVADTSAIRSLWADLSLTGDTLRVYTNHLHSTQITSADDEFLSPDRFLSDTAREEKMRSIVRRFRDNCIARAAQADTVARAMAQSPYPRIVCGDFNDTPMSSVYHTMSHGVVDAFSEAGKGYSSTYRGFSNMLRIDFVLLSPRYEVLFYDTPDVDYSDHRPVVVKFRKRVN